MGKGTVEKFGLKAIVAALDGSDVLTARDDYRQLSARLWTFREKFKKW
jgi:hypothetical protein